MDNFFKSSSKGAQTLFSNVKKGTSNAVNSMTSFFQSGNPLSYVLAGLLFIVMLVLILYLTDNIIGEINDIKQKKIINGTVTGTVAQTIYQDPSNTDSVTLLRSDNQDEGLEFSYSFWIYLNDWSYKYGEEKHVFHKGENVVKMDDIVNQCPRVTLDAKENKMHIYMNTYKNIEEYVTLDNLPLKKWICVSIVVVNRSLQLYVNGYLKDTFVLSSLPKQNYRDVQICRFGGFSGYLSNLFYYRYALDTSTITSYLRAGPSNNILNLDEEQAFNKIPPYFSAKWWN